MIATLALDQKGQFAWSEWSAMLGEAIKKAQAAGDPDTGETYYRHWLATLERTVAEKGAASTQALAQHFPPLAEGGGRDALQRLQIAFRRRGARHQLYQRRSHFWRRHEGARMDVE